MQVASKEVGQAGSLIAVSGQGRPKTGDRLARVKADTNVPAFLKPWTPSTILRPAS